MIRIPSLTSISWNVTPVPSKPQGNVVGIAGSSEVCFSIAWESCATNPFLEATWPWLDGGCIQNCHLWFQLEVGNIRNNVGKIWHVFSWFDTQSTGFSITDIALVSGCLSSYMIGTATRRLKIKRDTWWSYDHVLISRIPKPDAFWCELFSQYWESLAWDPDVDLDQLVIY